MRRAAALLMVLACARPAPPNPPAPKPVEIERPPGQPPVAASPQTILESEGVSRMQRALKKRGYGVTVDGRFGADTQRALFRFQRQSGLAPTGMPDIATLKALGLDALSLYGSSPPVGPVDGGRDAGRDLSP